MLKASFLAGALVTSMLAAGEVRTMPTTAGDPGDTVWTGTVLAQGGGAGGSGDSAGRGPDTSKGAVPNPPESYPSGIGSPGTAPVPPGPGVPASPGSPGATGTGTSGGTAGTGAGTTTGATPGSPRTTEQGGTTRTDR